MMTTHKHNWWRSLWEPLHAAMTESPLLTAGEQTKLTWARPIESLAEAPPFYVDSLQTLAAEAGCLPRCILTPSYAGFMARTTEKLVCCHNGKLRVWERAGSEVRSTTYSLRAIDHMEFGSILLKAWLKIAGADERGQYGTTTIKFNAITDYLFFPILNTWRSGGLEPGTASLAAEKARFDCLGKDHYKFMNVARRLLLPGDRVRAFVMQPEMRSPVAQLFGRTWSRLKAPAHIVLLTERELIAAAEESQRGWRDEGRYGSISTYVPLSKITGVQARRTPQGDLHVTINLPSSETLALDFAAENAAEAERLLALLPIHAVEQQEMA